MRSIRAYIALVAVFVALQAAAAFGFAPDGQDCTKCHTMNTEQATAVLKNFFPDVKVMGVADAPIKGLWEVTMESGGKKGVLYLDYSKKKLIAGNVFDTTTKASYTKETYDRINKIDVSLIPYDKALLMGDKDAKIKVAVFDDPD